MFFQTKFQQNGCFFLVIVLIHHVPEYIHLFTITIQIFFTGLILSGGATMLFSTGSSLPVFASLWFVNGFAQGAGWPACAKLLKKVCSLFIVFFFAFFHSIFFFFI